MPRAVLPVGFEQFQRRSFVNYQFNRAYALGFADHAELCGAASQVRSPQHCVSVFEDLSRRAAADRSLVADDGLHPSGIQYALWVERIVPVVQGLIGRASSGRWGRPGGDGALAG